MKVFIEHPETGELLDADYHWTNSGDAAKDFYTVPAAVDMALALNLSKARILLRSEDPVEPDLELPTMAIA